MRRAVEKPVVLVCVTGQKSCERLIRYGAFLCAELGAELSVVHVAKPGAALMSAGTDEAHALEFLYDVAAKNGASLTILRSKRTLEAIAVHAREIGAVALVTGTSAPGSGPDFVQTLRERVPSADVHALPCE